MPYAPLVSLIVGVTNVIPFFGPFMGAVPSAFLILLVSPKKCLIFVIFVIVLQQFDGNILGPKILGDATGISSFWVVVAILVGGGFGGVLGMFLGVPVFACLQVLVKYLVDRRLRRRNMPTEAYCYVNRDRESQPPEQQS
jgi:predicted PurR-regulated permease PerM